jgi:tight adherence protein B
VTAAGLAALAAWVCLPPSGWSPGRRGARRPGQVGLVLAIGVAVFGLLGGAPEPTALALVVAGAAWGGQRLWQERVVARSVAVARERVLECCDLLAAELTAGQPAGTALGRAAEAWPAMGPVAQTLAYGGDVPSALRRAAGEPGAEGLALVAAAWQVSHRTGHGLAEALLRVAQALRVARSTERVVHGELASARATARLVAALPVLALGIGAGSGGNPVGFLLGTPLGLACLAGGLGLGLAGLTWIERIAAGVGR